MYLNTYQKCIERLIDEYGCLSKPQLLCLVNAELKAHLPHLDGFIAQMCRYGDFTVLSEGGYEAVARRNTELDFCILRSLEVMLSFMPNVVAHHKGREPVTVRFFTKTGRGLKDVCIIPVRQGEEKMAAAYAKDKFTEKEKVAIFLLDCREQMQFIQAKGKFAIVGIQGVSFYKN